MTITFKTFLNENQSGRYTADEIQLKVIEYVIDSNMTPETVKVLNDMFKNQSYYNQSFKRNVFSNKPLYRFVGFSRKKLGDKQLTSTSQILSLLQQHEMSSNKRPYYSWTYDKKAALQIAKQWLRHHEAGVILETEVAGLQIDQLFNDHDDSVLLSLDNIKSVSLASSTMDDFGDDYDEELYLPIPDEVYSEKEVLAPKNTPLSIMSFALADAKKGVVIYDVDDFKEFIEHFNSLK